MNGRLVTSAWQRLSPATAGLLALVLLGLGVLVIALTDRESRADQADRARVRAQILAASVVAAVDFGDAEAAREAVSAFRVDPATRIVAVYGPRGMLLSGIARPGDAVPEQLAGLPSFGDAIAATVGVERDGERIGTVYLLTDEEGLARRLARYFLIGLLAVMAALLVGVLGLAQGALRRANAELAVTNRELLTQIEEREKAESQLRQAQKMEAIGQLTGGIAHDFNNMLAIVIGGLDLADRRFESHPAKARASIGHALEGANRAADLTRRLLAFARRQPLEPQPIDANQLVARMSELLRRSLGEGVLIETILAGGLWRTHADPGQLESAILNLCVNARDAMEGAGRLTIETMNAHLDDDYAARHDEVEAGQYVAIAVSDNGPGMPRDVIDRAFEPFYTTKSVGKGTGLGLAQVYGFVRQSGGHVKIYSEVGQGTTVKIYLKRFRGQPIDLPFEEIGEEAPRGAPDELILVVEDEDQVRRMTTDSLRELGYPVIEAPNAAEALKIIAARDDIRLLFTDIVMPEMNGRQLADQVKALRPGLPVLFTTGYTRNAVVHNGVVDSDVFFIAKPFTIERLARKVRELLDAPEAAPQRR